MILDGKKLAEKIKSRLIREIKKAGLRPGLASILVGDDPASVLYISIKEREAKRVGIHFKRFHLPHPRTTSAELCWTPLNPPTQRGGGQRRWSIANLQLKILKLIDRLNRNSKIHGILVQLPLPKGFNTQKIINAIDPRKDVDGFHPENVKLLKNGKPRFVSPPHAAILALIKAALRISNIKYQISELRAAIVANSKTFAEPLKILLEKNDIKTDFYVRARTPNMKKANIIIIAKGKPKYITARMIKRGTIVIDVGTNRLRGKLVGDVDFLPVARKAGAITPVPGGVGPMTVAMLLKNTVRATQKRN